MTALNSEQTQTDSKPIENVVEKVADVNIAPQQQKNEDKKPAEAQETHEDPNWKAFREARKRDRAEKEAAERRAAEKEAEAAALKAAMEAAFAKAPATQHTQTHTGYASYETEETEDQRLEKKLNAILAAREQQWAQEQQTREQREYPQRLAKEFPDFKQVCSQENLDYLDYHYPELSRPLGRLPDGFDKWADIYHAVKKFIPNHANAKKEAARADFNSNKPKSMSSQGPSPSGEKARETWQESEQRRAENWARMQRIMKGV